MDYQTLRSKDSQYLWHPFTQMQDYNSENPIVIERAEGIKLIDVNGKEYYDSISSLWVNVHGHTHPEINKAIIEQLGKVAHSTLLGQSNVPAILLAEKLVEITPDGLNKVFYSDSGSEAVEIAIKLAHQYWQLKGSPRKTLIKMENAYHGDTIGAVSAGGMAIFHDVFKDLLFDTVSVPYPHAFRFDGSSDDCYTHCLDKLEEALETNKDESIALILEPLVQGAAGMIMMPPGYLKDVEKLCRKYKTLLITDEVATGFGRTGKMYACQHEDVQPDILCTAKGLSGGYLPLAATLTTDEIYTAFLGEHSEMKAFFHGHSFTGNQLGCAAALASIKLFEESNLINHVQLMAEFLTEKLHEFKTLKHIADIRQCGLMLGLEIMQDPQQMIDYDPAKKVAINVAKRCCELGMWSRPLG
ncbi:MAG: adenosylmethionine--8-amino-7-oxononanoate transaminase, partial [Lentisphaeria bacterium]|nr:adenosylmethionine--8-amino-7-oxononanoate transaminase [Lentisphaeria bacterium]